MINKLQCGIESLCFSRFIIIFQLSSLAFFCNRENQHESPLWSFTINFSNRLWRLFMSNGTKKILTKHGIFLEFSLFFSFYTMRFFIRICATFHLDYSHWNWILNYYLMNSSVLSLGPSLASEKIAIYHNLDLFIVDPRIFLLNNLRCIVILWRRKRQTRTVLNSFESLLKLLENF